MAKKKARVSEGAVRIRPSFNADKTSYVDTFKTLGVGYIDKIVEFEFKVAKTHAGSLEGGPVDEFFWDQIKRAKEAIEDATSLAVKAATGTVLTKSIKDE